ncbi:unnamed protein product, partial [Phaeothamnion confervicola]
MGRNRGGRDPRVVASRRPEDSAPPPPVCFTPPEAVLALQARGGNRAVASLFRAPAAPNHEGPLPVSVREGMETLFGRSFGDVRIHQGGLAERRGAAAVTTGPDIHMASGRFDP